MRVSRAVFTLLAGCRRVSRLSRLRFVNAVGSAVTLSLLVALAQTYLRAQNPLPVAGQDPGVSAQQLTDCLASGNARMARHAKTGVVRFVGSEPGRPIPNPSPAEAGRSPEAAARAYLSACGSLFGVTDQAGELTLSRATAADAGRSVLRFQQRQAGVRVLGGELIVYLDNARNIVSVAGKTLPQPPLNITAGITAAAAIETALDTVAKTYGVDRALLVANAPELWLYSPVLISPEQGPTTLVWRLDVTPRQGLLPIRELVLVDAERGSVPVHFNQIETARNRTTYTANNTTALPGTLVCNESNPSCAGGDADAVAAHVYAGDTYNFYQSNFGRDSLDNAGLTLVSTVHYGDANYQNAFWNGAQMAYGNGFAAADDVVGHELTHGVTQYTSNLFYYYQSGAINESFSDVFGEFIDQTNGRGTDTAGVRWQMGEDVPGIGSIRNMQDPTLFGDPDKMTSPNYYPGAIDNGGVHFNSGINNKAAYLMVDGGPFNGQTITGLGIPKVAKIYYEVQTHLLTSGSDYADLGDALYQGCNNLVGTAGITSSDCQQVRNATLAVEMNLQPQAGFNPDAPVCTAGQTTATIFFDNVESASNFTVGAAVGSPRWSLVSGFAHSGTKSLHADDVPAVPADTFVALTNGVVLPPGAFLHFAHAFGFEVPNIDGGVVEYSLNGGATWNDAGSLFDTNGYNGTISNISDNPLSNRPAFVAASHGYISSRLNLSSLAGQTVRFRWRMGLDTGGFDRGWFLDDVRIYSCGGATLTSVVPNVGPQGQAVNVVVTGKETHFAQGQTTASFGSGITVNGTTVTDATHLTASLTIAGNAALGARDVSVTTGNELAVASNGFTVTAGPVIGLVAPNKGQPGLSNLNVSITGQFTHFAQGTTTASLGAGITVNSTSVTDPNHLTVNLSIAGNATPGLRTVTLVTGGEVATRPNGFLVRSLPVDTQVYAYVVGRRLSPSQGGTTGLQTVSVINTSTNAVVATIPAGIGCFCVGPDGVVVDPDGTRAYVPNELDNTVTVIDTASNTVVATVPVGTGPIGVAETADGTRLYVVNGSSPTSVSAIDTATNQVVASIPLGVVQARGIAVVPDGSRVYVSTYGSNTVKVIDTASNSVIATIPVGSLPVGVDVTPDGSLVYVANYLGNTFSVISTATNAVVATISVATHPNSARVTPDGTRAYVTGDTNTSVVNTQTNAIVGTVNLSGSTLEFIPDGSRAYLANYSNIQIINTLTNTVSGSIPFSDAINGRPAAVAMTPGPIRVMSMNDSLAFGRVRIGSKASATLTISNAGNSPLTVSNIGFPAGFSGNWTSGTIAPGGSQNVVVTFTPIAPASYGGPIIISANQTRGPNQVTASGVGVRGIVTRGDFDGDLIDDISVYHTSAGTWNIRTSGSGFAGSQGYAWGLNTDLPVPGDYDGDGKTDVAVYRPSSGHWFILKSSTTFTSWDIYQWGAGGDVPVPGDYDGDGRTDIAVYRPSSGHWFILKSSTTFTSWDIYQWGAVGDVPAAADYDGDGRTDICVFRPSDGLWFVLKSTTDFGAWDVRQLGAAGDIPVPGDYDGDGKAEIAVYRPSNGTWTLLFSTSGYAGGATHVWGISDDVPVVGDFDGDGKTDISVFRPSSGHWFMLTSSTNFTGWFIVQSGTAGDLPILKRP